LTSREAAKTRGAGSKRVEADADIGETPMRSMGHIPDGAPPYADVIFDI
jgi:hypothetical protein